MKYMRITLAAIILGSFIMTTNVSGADRYENYEMADDNTISFKITSNGMTVVDENKEIPGAVKPESDRMRQKWVKSFELPQSGQIIEFPLSVKEIRAARKEAEQKTAINETIRKVTVQKAAGFETSVIEMADGNSVIFKTDKKKKSSDIGSWLTRLFKGND